MKLHLPKALMTAMAAAMVAGNAYAVDDTNMQWANNSGVFKWTGTGWQVGTLISGHEITDWENGYTWADSTGPVRGGTNNNMGPVLLIDGTSGDTTGNKDTSDNGGVVAINGATANVNLGGWGGNVYVEEGCDVRAYLENGQWGGGYRLKSMNAQKYSLVANGKLTFTSAVSFDNGSANQKWYIGNGGSVTFNNTFTVNKPLALEVEVHGASLHDQEVANRTENRSVISGPVTVDSGGSVTITYKNDVTGATISNVYPTTLSSSGITAGFTKETLVWKGGEGKEWTNGADGWYIQGDAGQTDTGFINGDNVVFNTADSVTLGGDITFGNMTANAAATVTADSNKLHGGTVTATNGILTIQGGETHFNKLTTTGTGVIKLQNGYFAGTEAEGDVLTINGNVDLGGNNLSARHGATINIEGGTVSTTRFIAHAANDYGRNDTINIKGGIVNVKKDDTTNTNLEQSGIIAGHWHTKTNNDANANHMITVDGGVLNAAKANLLVSWDSRAYFNVNSGEANVNKLIIGGQNNPLAAKVYLRGGRLNIGTGGITTVQTSVSERLVISGGTLGTLTESEISTAAPISITTSGSFTIDTQVHSINESKESDVTDGAGSITINGVISGNGAMEKTGAGILKLNGANSSYSGTITVNKGTLIANHADALGTGAITVGANGTLEYAVDCTLTNTNTYTGTVQLDNGVTATLDGAVSVGALALGGDASVSLDVSGDISLAATTVTLNNHTLTLDFGTPTVSYTSDTTISNLVTGLSGAASGLDIVFAGSSAALKAGETNVWQAMLGRSTYEWRLDDAGALSLYVETSRAMTLVWNGASTEWNQVSDNTNWNKESDSVATCFENGDSVRFSESATAMLDGAITANVLRVDDGATVSLTSKTDIDTDSLTVTDLRLGSAKAEGAAATPGTQSLTLNALNTTTETVTVEEGKTASLTLAQGATLTVNDEILANKAASLTVDGAVAGVSSIKTAAGTETENGGSVTITGAVTGNDLAINAGDKGSITLQGNVTGISSITAGENASVSITGNTTGTFTTLTAGEGGSISLTGATITSGTGLTINGDVTIGTSIDASTFTSSDALKIEGGTTTFNAKRNSNDNSIGKITVDAGATLDATNGQLWRVSRYVSGSGLNLYGKLIAKDFGYNNNTFGNLNHNAENMRMYNGAEMVFTGENAALTRGLELSGDAGSGGLYTLTFADSVKSATMTFAGALSLGANHANRGDVILCFNTEGDTVITLDPVDTDSGQYGNHDKGFTNASLTVRKDGTGTLKLIKSIASKIDVDNGTFAFGEGGSTSGTIDVAAGATLAYAGGTHTIGNLTFADGARLYVQEGTATLNQELEVKRVRDDKFVYLGNGATEGKLAFGGNGSLTYDGVTYTAKAGGTDASITGTGGTELSLYHSAQTYKDLSITMDGAGTAAAQRQINAVFDNVDLSLGNSHVLLNQDRTLADLAVDATSGFYVADNKTATVSSATIKSGSTLSLGSGAKLTDGAISIEQASGKTLGVSTTNTTATDVFGEDAGVTVTGAAVTANSATDYTWGATLGGDTSVKNAGSGKLTLSGENSYFATLFMDGTGSQTVEFTKDAKVNVINGGDDASKAGTLSIAKGATVEANNVWYIENVLNNLTGEGKLVNKTAVADLGGGRALSSIAGNFEQAENLTLTNTGNSPAVSVTGSLTTKKGFTINGGDNGTTLTVSGGMTAEGGLTFADSQSKLQVASDNVELKSAVTAAENVTGHIEINKGNTLKITDALVSKIDFTSYGEGEGNGKIYISAGEALKGCVEEGASGNAPTTTTSLMKDCSLQATDVVISAAGATEAFAAEHNHTLGTPYTLDIMSGITLAAGDSFTLTLVGLENYTDVKLYWSSVGLVRSFGEGDATALAGTVDLDANGIGSMAYNGGAVLFESTSGTVVNVWATYNIPEPTTATLSVLALAGLAARRRRKR